MTGVFVNQPIYFSILYGHLTIRLILAVIITPIIFIYLRSEGYVENSSKKIWQIIDFKSDLETKIEGMEEVIKHSKELEVKLKESEEKYFLALEGANAGIWDWNIEKNYIMYSHRFCALLGFEKGELGDTIEAFKLMLHPDDAEKTLLFIDECLKNKKKYSIEYRLKNKDGSYKWYLSSGVTKYNNLDKPVRMVGSIIDINDKKITAESYKEKLIELEQFNKSMVNRELKMAELKEEIIELKSKIKE